MNISPSQKKTLTLVAVAAGVVLVAWWAWSALSDNGPGAGFVRGNGRIEATEIDVATRLPGRVEEILVREGDFVKAGQPLARMQLIRWTPSAPKPRPDASRPSTPPPPPKPR